MNILYKQANKGVLLHVYGIETEGNKNGNAITTNSCSAGLVWPPRWAACAPPSTAL